MLLLKRFERYNEQKLIGAKIFDILRCVCKDIAYALAPAVGSHSRGSHKALLFKKHLYYVVFVFGCYELCTLALESRLLGIWACGRKL